MKPADPRLRSVSEVLDDPVSNAALFNAFPSLLWCSDGSGGCSFVNQAWEDYTGRRLESATGTGWLDAVHPDDRPELVRRWAEVQFVGAFCRLCLSAVVRRLCVESS